MNMKVWVGFIVWTLGLSTMAQVPRDGMFIDPGIKMKERAEGAPEEIDQGRFLLGQWDVDINLTGSDGKQTQHKGLARFDRMNRGHGILGRFSSADINGKPWHTLHYFVYNKATSSWGEGIADSVRCDIRIFSGGFVGKKLELHDVVRPLGGLGLVHYRATYEPDDQGGFRYDRAKSRDHGKTWSVECAMTFKGRANKDGFLEGSSRYGEPDPNRLAPAAENDFLIGDWTATHQMTFPNGQKASWNARANAIHVLNGMAVMEFNAFDTDPNLPDAATSIIRIYNPAMNRWESLYTTNRSSGLLHFGGVMQDGKMVLTMFQSHAADASLNHFVFHDMNNDDYRWYGEVSSDGGQTYKKFWIIDFKRKSGP